MVTLGRFSEMYVKFQFWGSGGLKLARKVYFGTFIPIKGIN